jgi:hypothetical protein
VSIVEGLRALVSAAESPRCACRKRIRDADIATLAPPNDV